jgi:hypothetical protein
MKNFTIIFVVLIAVSVNSYGQITNNGFENWTTLDSYDNPDGWVTYNQLSTGSFYSCTKSTDHYPESIGNYSMRLENNTSLTQMTGGWGMAITNAMNYPIKPSFPIVGHPNSLTGYYKYYSANDDSLFIRIMLFENGTVKAAGSFLSNITTTSWTPFSIPISSYSSADSATISIIAFYPHSATAIPKGNSVLYVDNLSFDNFITSDHMQTSEKSLFTIYPNSASTIISITSNGEGVLTIYNTIGAVVKTEHLTQSQQEVNISNLPCGVYTVHVKSGKTSNTQKLIIQR